MDAFEQLKSMVVFAQVVEQGSLTGAAKQLNLSRAVISYHLKKLEAQLNVKLLNRSTRSIAVTQAGKDYYQCCRVITEQANIANQQVETLQSEPQGLLRITCPVNVGLQIIVPALNQFMSLYPKITLDVNLTDDVVNIMNQGIDLAIRGAPLVDLALQAKKFASLKTCLCASPDYLQQYGRPTTPKQLANHQWVVYQLASKKVRLTKNKKHYDVVVAGSISTNNSAARTAFVEGGHGVGRIPYYDAHQKVANGTLEILLADYRLTDIELYGVFPPGVASSKKMRLLLDFLSDYFKQDNIRH